MLHMYPFNTTACVWLTRLCLMCDRVFGWGDTGDVFCVCTVLHCRVPRCMAPSSGTYAGIAFLIRSSLLPLLLFFGRSAI